MRRLRSSTGSPPAGPTGSDTSRIVAHLPPGGVTERFGGITAVDNVDLDLRDGEIIGRNGAGKTTLMNCISGFLKIEAGRIGMLALLSGICDTLIALETGAVIATGTPDEVLSHPPVIEAYLAPTRAPTTVRVPRRPLRATSRVGSVDPTFRARHRTIRIDGPAAMGIVNASPESFSGDGGTTLDQQVAQVAEQFAAGALLVDLGGQSANTKTPELAVAAETSRLVPLIEAVRAAGIDGLLSIDTYKPAVADACLRAGADVINDVSALHHPELADVVAEWGAGFVLMHTVGAPKVKILETDLYDDVVTDVLDFAHRTLDRLEAAGVSREQVLFDPGVDFAKTPRQSLDLVHGVGRMAELGRPLLLALSRKDFIGALTRTTPRRRDAGTLAAIAAVAAAVPETVFRVHDVVGTVQLLAVLGAIADPERLPADTVLDDALRREPIPEGPAG